MAYPNLVRILAIGLTASILATPSFAQATEEDETANVEVPPGFVLPPRLRQIAFRDANPWTFHVSARFNTGKPSIEFGNLGNVPGRQIPGADVTDVSRAYDDGAVVLDGPRTNEVDDDGNQTSTPGGRYQVPVEGQDGVYLDLLAYTPGQTRTWAYAHDSQNLGNGRIAMSAFSAESTGASYEMEHDGGSLGFEMSVGRRLFKLGPKTEIGFSGSIGITDVTAEREERVVSNLIKLTDIYQVYGAVPDAFYQAPTFEDLFDDIGNAIVENGVETTVPLQQITADRTITVTPNGAFVDGSYKVKGAYYSIRLGPEIRTHLSEKLAVHAGVGFIGAYVGSDFTVNEVLDMSGYEVASTISVSESNEYKELITGFYGELNIEYWLSPRTSIFLGGVYESLDDFVQNLGGRTASIVLGNNLIVRVGIITRF
ncbi:hypothetical protein [Actomonas aquatica]|uniref:Outer membrane protein beta-barrel domain-containing protein n=1 Tax=Actomonas aquatica TaxID=2866162 RepID=A0ABZ1C9G7_9BACT|nr:hypothetical protein [Opitutus sp. WL0086]WRQ88161.1 hypothetical protein K1X11_001995 [Opitutus sp. WL0086]